MKVYVDAASNILYSSFYIHGLYEVYGKENVKFKSKPFYDIKNHDYVLPIIIKDGVDVKKVIIDFTDAKHIDEEALAWCHVYGKVNLDTEDKDREKIIALGPSFGVRLFSFYSSIYFSMINYFKARQRIRNSRRFFSLYKRQLQRMPYSAYSNTKLRTPYIFFVSSLWKNESKVNKYRLNFIKACKEIEGVDFEGGFVPRSNNDISGFEADTIKRRISMEDYLVKTKASTLVFNTPAVKECHGWKLAEYLCLGKAIISTNISRVLPAALLDRKQILLTDGSKNDIKNCIGLLMSDDVLHNHLQRNALIYFDHHLSPKCVIKKLCNV